MEKAKPEAKVNHPSKAEWDEIAVKLDRIFDPVYLRCDGFYVFAVMMRHGKNKLAIQVAVNGFSFNGKWLPSLGRDNPKEMSEEARRFWMPRTMAKMTQKELKSWEKIIGKRECRKRGYYDKFVWPKPLWNRPRSLINHLKKHNQSIEIIDSDTYTEWVDAQPKTEGETK